VTILTNFGRSSSDGIVEPERDLRHLDLILRSGAEGGARTNHAQVKRIVLLIALVAVGWSGVAADSVASGPASRVLRVEVAEWSIVPAAGVVAAGPTRIVVRNLGEDVHQITLVRTIRFGASLPLRDDHAVVRPIAVSGVVAGGHSTSFTVTLRPGSYVLLDNLPWNYWRGASVAFTAR
jgi:hypothetical protein